MRTPKETQFYERVCKYDTTLLKSKFFLILEKNKVVHEWAIIKKVLYVSEFISGTYATDHYMRSLSIMSILLKVLGIYPVSIMH